VNKRIIYKTANNGVAVIIPSENVLSIEDVAAKDVPVGVQYKIVDVSEIPTDRTFRNAWEWQD
jgi:ribosomal protein S12